MRIKQGVRIAGIKPELLFGLMVADSFYKRITGTEMTVTAIVDGVHKSGSRHYMGLAADIRTRDLPPPVAAALVAALKLEIDADFDIVLEADHIHLEYDPK